LLLLNQLHNLKQLPVVGQAPHNKSGGGGGGGNNNNNNNNNNTNQVKVQLFDTEKLKEFLDKYAKYAEVIDVTNTQLERQIRILGLAGQGTKAVVSQFDILEERVRDIAKEFNLTSGGAIEVGKQIDKLGLKLGVNTKTAKAYFTEINKLTPGLGRLDKVSQPYFKNLLRSNDILRERLNLSDKEALSVRKLTNLQNRELIPSIDEYIQVAAQMQDENITGAFQTFFGEISETSTDILAQYSRMMPEALMRTTVEAKRFGLTLTDLKKTGDGMLDIQKQTQATYEFQLFTGKRLETQNYKNVAAAYNRATIEGDAATQMDIIKELTRDHRKELIENIEARRTLAQMLNMDEGKLLDIVTLQDELNDLTTEQEGQLSAAGLEALNEIETLLSDQFLDRRFAKGESALVRDSGATFDAKGMAGSAAIADAVDKITKGLQTDVGQMFVGAMTVGSFIQGAGGAIKGGLSPAGGLKPTTGGGKRFGGPVASGTSYMVGEMGPEIFTPSSAGTITPNNQISSNNNSGTRAIIDALKSVKFNVINNFDGSAILTSIELAEGNRLT